MPVAPAITWATPAPIVYGALLGSAQLNASANAAGNFTYSPAAGTMLTAGAHTLTATFTPADSSNYTTASVNVTLQVNQATPMIAWAAPAPIVYGALLGSSQLNASANVAGGFTYLPVSGTMLTAGAQTLTAIFTPADSSNYTTASVNVTLQVNQATPMIAWATPAPIVYGALLGSAQLNASANAAGNFTYSPVSGTMLTAGAQTLTATFTPADSSNYTTASVNVTLQVNQATPSIAWAAPAPVTVGTALSSTQLNAVVKGVDGDVLRGSAVYAPAAGSVLSSPGAVSLSLTFTPTDSINYSTGFASITLLILAPVAPKGYNWQSVKIVDGGVMPGVVTHPSEKGLMYVRGDVGGVYRWDATKSLWTPLMDFITQADGSLMSVESMAIDPSDPNRLYIAAGTSPWYAVNAAIFASGDRGVAMSRVNLPFKLGGNDIGHMGGERLAVNPFKSNEIYLGTRGNGLWRSSDYGSTWGQLGSFPIASSTDQVGIEFVRFDPKHIGVVYAAVFANGLYRSADSGATWALVPGQPAMLPNGDAVRPMRSALGPDGMLYLTYANSADFTGINNGAVYKFNTADGSWTNITPPGPNGETNLWYGFCAVTADAQHSGVVMAATWNRWSPGDTIYRSSNSGKTWTSLREHSVLDGSLSPWVYYGTSTANFGVWIATLEIDPFDSNHAIYQGGNTMWATHDLTNLVRCMTLTGR